MDKIRMQQSSFFLLPITTFGVWLCTDTSRYLENSLKRTCTLHICSLDIEGLLVCHLLHYCTCRLQKELCSFAVSQIVLIKNTNMRKFLHNSSNTLTFQGKERGVTGCSRRHNWNEQTIKHLLICSNYFIQY